MWKSTVWISRLIVVHWHLLKKIVRIVPSYDTYHHKPLGSNTYFKLELQIGMGHILYGSTIICDA